MIGLSYYDSPVGQLLIECSDDALSGIWFVGQKYFPAKHRNAKPVNDNSAIMLESRRWLDEYFSGGRPEIARLRLRPTGSEFRREIYAMLCEIPYGCTTSYGQLAKDYEARHGRRMSAQAVGGAVGHNPISIVIPCHRVIGAKSALTGYAGGLDKKMALLSLEGIEL